MKNNFRFFREKAKLTQKEVALAAKITQQSYSNYESGIHEANYSVLLKLSEIYHTTINELLGEPSENLIIVTKKDFIEMKEASETLNTLIKKITTDAQAINIHDTQFIQDNHGTIIGKTDEKK